MILTLDGGELWPWGNENVEQQHSDSDTWIKTDEEGIIIHSITLPPSAWKGPDTRQVYGFRLILSPAASEQTQIHQTWI